MVDFQSRDTDRALGDEEDDEDEEERDPETGADGADSTAADAADSTATEAGEDSETHPGDAGTTAETSGTGSPEETATADAPGSDEKASGTTGETHGHEDHSQDEHGHGDHSHDEHGHDHSHSHSDHSHDDHSHDDHSHDHGHGEQAESLGVAVVTVSSTRTREDDPSGDLIQSLVTEAGHEVATRDVVRDDLDGIQNALLNLTDRSDVDVVVTTGGTGVTPDDVTVEAASPLFDKELPGFGELFRILSYEDVGTMAMVSRATAGVADGVAVFCLPGSEPAVRLGMEDLVLEEMGHVVSLATRDQ